MGRRQLSLLRKMRATRIHRRISSARRPGTFVLPGALVAGFGQAVEDPGFLDTVLDPVRGQRMGGLPEDQSRGEVRLRLADIP